MKFCVIFFLFFAVCTAASVTPAEDNSLMLRGSFQFQILTNIRLLIEQLIGNLQTAANEALTAIGTFETGLLNQAELVRQQLISDLQALQDRINQIVLDVMSRVTGSATAVRDCVEAQRENAYGIFNQTLLSSFDCIEQRITDISSQIQSLRATSVEALAYSETVVTNMQNCINANTGSLINTAQCLGTVALSSQLQTAVFVARIATQVGRLNLAISTVPASLELCVGGQLISAGIATGSIIVQIGSCSATSVITNLIGGNTAP